MYTSFEFVGDAVVPKKGKTHGLKLFQRFHFASALKRMSVIAGHTPHGLVDTEYMASVKGAPETLRSMVSDEITIYLSHSQFCVVCVINLFCKCIFCLQVSTHVFL